MKMAAGIAIYSKSAVINPKAQSNNGLHPTANQRTSHRELVVVEVECAAGDAGRYAFPSDVC